MQLSRARRLSSASTTCHGASAMSVWTNISSLAREKSTQRAARSRSIVESFQRRIGSSSRDRKRRSCSSSLTENQYLSSRIPSSTSSRSKIGHWCRNRSVLFGGAEAEHVLDAGAVVPAAIEEHDLAGRRQVGDVALEVPLRLLALGRARQRDDAGDARVEVLGDALDRAALAGGVATFEDDHDAAARDPHPLLHLHELGLEAQQLGLVDGARHARRPVVVDGRRPLPLAAFGIAHGVDHGTSD